MSQSIFKVYELFYNLFVLYLIRPTMLFRGCNPRGAYARVHGENTMDTEGGGCG